MKTICIKNDMLSDQTSHQTFSLIQFLHFDDLQSFTYL